MRIFNKISKAIRTKVRYKILVLVLFPILLVMPVALVLAVNWGEQFTYQQLFLKVRTDLNVSHDAFDRIRQDYLNNLERLAESYSFRIALETSNKKSILDQVSQLRKQGQFSFLNVIASDSERLALDHEFSIKREL